LTRRRSRRSSVPLSAAQRIDEISDRFEKAWLAGQRLQIEDYLVPASDRSVRH